MLPARVRYIGQIPDLTAWLAGLRLTVAPLRYGAGAKGKVASSLAHGVPVVATGIAAEGMGLRAGRDVLVAGEPESFAQAVAALHHDAEVWQRLSTGALDFARAALAPAVGRSLFSDMLSMTGVRCHGARAGIAA